MMNVYEKQAQDFLNKSGTTFTAKFLRHAPYFPEDKESRDIYEIMLFRPVVGEKYVFTFGQSIANTGQRDNYITGQKTQKRIAPTAYDVLTCLTKYEPPAETWEFAREYGYEINSRADYNQIDRLRIDVQTEYAAVRRLFWDCMDELSEIS